QRGDRVEGEVVEPAAGVELEVVLLDPVCAVPAVAPPNVVEAGDRERRLEAVSEDGAVDVRRRVAQTREPTPLELDGQDALERRASGIEIANRRALERGGPRIRRAHRGGEIERGADLLGGGAAELGDGDGSADRAPRPVRVDVRARGGGAADARADLVAGHDRLEQPPAIQTTLFGDRERAGDHVDRAVAAA